jgi:hypothetical protein
MLGHNYLDVLKIDIEGGEWDALEMIFPLNTSKNTNNPRYGHLLIELHWRVDKKIYGSTQRLLALVTAIERAGYVLYSMEFNNLDCPQGVELGWVHGSLVGVPSELEVPLVPPPLL